MVFRSEVLNENITIAEPLIADLHVSTTGNDADYAVNLIDVFPSDNKVKEGQEVNLPLGHYQMLVRGEIIRGKFRNSLEKPEPFIPGKIAEVTF